MVWQSAIPSTRPSQIVNPGSSHAADAADETGDAAQDLWGAVAEEEVFSESDPLYKKDERSGEIQAGINDKSVLGKAFQELRLALLPEEADPYTNPDGSANAAPGEQVEVDIEGMSVPPGSAGSSIDYKEGE